MSTVERPLAITFHADPPCDWDGFVMQCEPSHFEQTSWWANVESMDGWNAKYVVARDMGRIAAGAMVLVRRQNRLGRVGYIFRGPLTRPELSNSEHLQRSMATAVKSFVRRERLVLLTVVPAYDGTALASTFLKMGFLRHPRSLPPSDLPPGTITVDLRREPGVIEQSFHKTLRNQIRQARKKGVVVKLGTTEDLELFWERHLELCRRRGVVSNVPGFGFVRRVWQEFHPLGRAWLFNAILGEDVLCSTICLGVGNWFYAWRIGWAPRSEKFYSTQAADAQAIHTAAEAGYQFFDFMGIHPDEVASIERGENLNTPTSGITYFKMSFGGSVRTLPPTLDWFPNPVLRLFMRRVGLWLFSAVNFLKFVRLLTQGGRLLRPHRRKFDLRFAGDHVRHKKSLGDI